MAGLKPINYDFIPEAGMMNCVGCDFFVNEFDVLFDCCRLSEGEMKEFTHLHGCCANNHHIYKLKEVGI